MYHVLVTTWNKLTMRTAYTIAMARHCAWVRISRTVLVQKQKIMWIDHLCPKSTEHNLSDARSHWLPCTFHDFALYSLGSFLLSPDCRLSINTLPFILSITKTFILDNQQCRTNSSDTGKGKYPISKLTGEKRLGYHRKIQIDMRYMGHYLKL